MITYQRDGDDGAPRRAHGSKRGQWHVQFRDGDGGRGDDDDRGP